MTLGQIYSLLSRINAHKYASRSPFAANYWEAHYWHLHSLCKAKGWKL